MKRGGPLGLQKGEEQELEGKPLFGFFVCFFGFGYMLLTRG
jgi:hypothetical protein